MSAALHMAPALFADFREIVYQQSGIALNSGKEALVSARVNKRLHLLGLSSYEEYIALLRDEQGQELHHFIDVISTNVTHFFREPDHFDILAGLARQWQGQRRLRVWSAACSTGEEPYTIAMTLRETLQSVDDVRILATDISTRALQSARDGRYLADKMNGVSADLRGRYFTKERQDGGEFFVAKDALRSLIAFRRLNLSKPPFPMRGPFDVVFCRNVMIYFDNRIREQLVNNIYQLLRPGGYLFVGHTESLTGLRHSFKATKPSVFVKS